LVVGVVFGLIIDIFRDAFLRWLMIDELKNFDNSCEKWANSIAKSCQHSRNDDSCRKAKLSGIKRLIYEPFRDNFPFILTFNKRGGPNVTLEIEYRVVLMRNLQDTVIRGPFLLALREMIKDNGDRASEAFVSYPRDSILACDLSYKKLFNSDGIEEAQDDNRDTIESFIKKLARFDTSMMEEFSKDEDI
jgi:hypothetical protein